MLLRDNLAHNRDHLRRQLLHLGLKNGNCGPHIRTKLPNRLELGAQLLNLIRYRIRCGEQLALHILRH